MAHRNKSITKRFSLSGGGELIIRGSTVYRKPGVLHNKTQSVEKVVIPL